VDGKANQELVAWLARELKVPRASIELIRGDTARRKQLRVAPASVARRPLGTPAYRWDRKQIDARGNYRPSALVFTA